jgi:hypothetical protein
VGASNDQDDWFFSAASLALAIRSILRITATAMAERLKCQSDNADWRTVF